MTNQLDPLAAWRAVLRAHSRAVRAIDADLAAAGVVPLAWYDVLLELSVAPDRRLRMQELGMRAVLSRTRVSRVVTELEEHGLVERTADAGDRRASLATLTAEGRRALRSAAPVYLAGIDRHFNRYLTTSQQRAIAAGLQRVVDAHDATTDPRR